LRALACPVVVYGTSRTGTSGDLTFKPIANRPFLEDLAACRALISTAGNQLVGEALYFGKPMLVMPEDCVEQRLNAAELERLGLGRQISGNMLTSEVAHAFLADLERYRNNIASRARDGRAEALELIERYLDEFAESARDKLVTAGER
jgi:uncharacterized protein (TIGR00661 family)